MFFSIFSPKQGFNLRISVEKALNRSHHSSSQYLKRKLRLGNKKRHTKHTGSRVLRSVKLTVRNETRFRMNIRNFLVPAGKPFSGLASGLSIFLTFLYLINVFVYPINDSIILKPDSLYTFDLNRISLYPLAHLSIFHLFFNVISIYPMISVFEESHGTLYTGVILNLLAVFSAIPYCIIGSVFFPNVEVGGASGWFFSFLGYFGVKESRIRPSAMVTATRSFPTIYFPLALLAITAFLVPGSSLPGHSIGLAIGYFMGFKENMVAKLVPPSNILKKIETFADPLINKIPFGIKYYREVEVNRASDYNSIYVGSESTLPLHSTAQPSEATPFQGNGRVLGA